MKTLISLFSIIIMLFLTISFTQVNDIYSQTPKLIWNSVHGGTMNGMDKVNDVISDQFGNIFVTGKCYNTFSGGDFTTVKYNSSGNKIWIDHYVNTSEAFENCGSRLAIDKMQNVYAVGTTALNEGDLAVCKYGSDGRIWAKNYEPYWFSTYEDFGIDIDTDSSGNFYAIARVTSPNGTMFDLYIMKCDGDGNKIWDDNYTGASAPDYPVAIEVTPGGTSYVLLQSFNFFGTQTQDIMTIQYLPGGVQNWFSNYNGAGNDYDYPLSIEVDPAGNQYVSGTADAGNDNDMVAMKQNEFGTRFWVITYAGTAGENDTAISALWLPDGKAVVTGNSRELLGGNVRNAIVTLIIDGGTIVRTTKFFGSDSLGAAASRMITDGSGNIYICGYENMTAGAMNGCLIKYDISGNLLWNISHDAGSGLHDIFTSMTLDINNDIIVTGQTLTSPSSSKFITLKFGNSSTGVNQLSSVAEKYSLHQNYPNPFNPETKISYNIPELSFVSLKVFDVLGKEIATLVSKKQNAGSYSVEWDASSFTSGIYFYKLQTTSFSETKRMILIK